MSKTNKLQRSLDEKQHHVSKAIKKEHTDRSVKNIDRMLRSKRYEQFYDDLDYNRDKEYWDEQ
jgi:hypothetical protein